MRATHTPSLPGSLLPLLLPLLLLLPGRAAATSGFSRSCDEIIVEPPTVQAKCTTSTPMGPPWVCTRLDLNQCLGSRAGTLVAEDGGHFTSTCVDCTEQDSLVLGCDCWTGRNSDSGRPIYGYSEFDLDTIVGNDHGYLRCFDNIAPKSSDC